MVEWRWPDDEVLTGRSSPSAAYELPSLLPSGQAVTVDGWRRERSRLLSGFAESTYGYTPVGGSLAGLTLLGRHSSPDGLGPQSQWIMTVRGPLGTLDVPLAIFEPAHPVAAGGSPVFLGMNIIGNHAIASIPGVRLGEWMPVAWPLRRILGRGYAVATLLNDSVEPDVPGAAWCGVRGLFEKPEDLLSQRPTQWGALGAWAWGLSRAREAVHLIEGLNGDRVIVHGHSRLGMAALWAAAQDERFAAAISSESGLGGASLTRHIEGEDVAFASSHFPHWFCGNYATFSGRDAEFPVDQHQLLALIAPRPVHVSSADQDRHADPQGEFLSTLHASPVYELLGGAGTLPSDTLRSCFDLAPAEAAAVPLPFRSRRYGSTLSYHVREGRHGVTESDWEVFLDFTDANGV